MNIEIGPNAVATIVALCTTVLLSLVLTAKRTSKAAAAKHMWSAWNEVAHYALSKGQPVPPTPHQADAKR